jgi:BMFP domain-containing protein YqiC
VAVVAQIYNTVIRAVGVGLKAREQEELEARLDELEAALERQDRRSYGA